MSKSHMPEKSKAQISKDVGRNRYVVFSASGEVYSATSRLLAHAITDAKECNGEIWLAGRIAVPAHNVC